MNSLDCLFKCLTVSFSVVYRYAKSWSYEKWEIFDRHMVLQQMSNRKVCICLRKQSAEKETFDGMFRQMRLAWASDANLIMFHCQTSHQSFFNFRLNSLWHRKLKYEIGDIICYITCLSLFNFLPHQSPFPFCFYLPFLISLYLLCLSY